MAPCAFSSLASVLTMLLASGVRAQLQPDFCGRDGLPCCPGDDAVGNRCQVNCSFTVCTGIGFDAFCEVPVAGDPDIGDAPTICKGCGSIGSKCCDDTAVGEEGSCSSRAGVAICKEVPGEDDPQCVACGREAGPCCGNDSCDGGLACVAGTCEEELVKIWQQCGGKNYSGPTQCEEGLECDVLNPYYSQCRPEDF